MMIEELQPPQDLLRTAAHEINDLGGTKKTMPVHLAYDVPVATGQWIGEISGTRLKRGRLTEATASLYHEFEPSS